MVVDIVVGQYAELCGGKFTGANMRSGPVTK